MFNRDEIRRLQKAARDNNKTALRDWLIQYDNAIRQEYDKAYKDELSSSIDNFMIAVAYTAHFSETTELDKDSLPEFMEDLFVTIDMFRLKEYIPQEYIDELKKCGIILDSHSNTNSHKIITLLSNNNLLKLYDILTEYNYIVLIASQKDNHSNIISKINISDSVFIDDKEKYKEYIEYAKNRKKTMYFSEEEIKNEQNK